MKIYKYQLETTDTQRLQLPIGAKILSLQVQRGIPCILCLVNETNTEMKIRTFEIYGTGDKIPSDILNETLYKFIGTYQLQNGSLVFHCFEYIP
jgi:hypothetical protein